MEKNTKLFIGLGVFGVAAVAAYLLLKPKKITTVAATVPTPVPASQNSDFGTIIKDVKDIFEIFKPNTTATSTPPQSTTTAIPATTPQPQGQWQSMMIPVYDNQGNAISSENGGFAAN